MVEVGQILEGKVTGLTDFGAFVTLPDGSTGMVHISEVASSYVKDIHEYLSENQEVKVKVLDINEKGKISLSIKKAVEQPEKQERQDFRDRPRRPRPQQKGWQGLPEKQSDGSFEDMLASFKKNSDEKQSDLKKSNDSKRGSRRGYGSKG